MKKKSLGYYLIILILGCVVGYLLGQLGQFIPPGAFKNMLLTPLKFGAGPGVLNLRVLSVTIGFSVNVNAVSVLGVFLVALAFKKN